MEYFASDKKIPIQLKIMRLWSSMPELTNITKNYNIKVGQNLRGKNTKRAREGITMKLILTIKSIGQREIAHTFVTRYRRGETISGCKSNFCVKKRTLDE